MAYRLRFPPFISGETEAQLVKELVQGPQVVVGSVGIWNWASGLLYAAWNGVSSVRGR